MSVELVWRGATRMRVIGGELSGRRFSGPGKLPVRPTGDNVRESLFGVLGRTVEDKTVLDLFAGVGSLGIEALSRGAREAVFVEADPRAARIIRGNLEILGLSGRARVLVLEVVRALRKLEREEGRFDLVFLDPPYEQDLAGPVLTWLSRSVILRSEGIVIFEHGAREKIQPRYGSLERGWEKRYGSKMISEFNRSN
ncbi:MAG: 16S rRNA (guanine(966)-N(2))-methyltransferase RsmD [bacterium]|nr:16S rRNA (guanine(966)-N(2))-methyltransferase RsmD [bacterium]